MGACTRYARHGLRIPCVRCEHRDTGPCAALRAAGRSRASRPPRPRSSRAQVCGRPGTSKTQRRGRGRLSWDPRIPPCHARDRAENENLRGSASASARGRRGGGLERSGQSDGDPAPCAHVRIVKTRVCHPRPGRPAGTGKWRRGGGLARVTAGIGRPG
jgi:hypothetical protein